MNITINLVPENIERFVWGNAHDLIASLSYEQVKRLCDGLDNLFCDDATPPTMTEVNDFLSFEDDSVAEILGYEDDEHFQFARDNDYPERVYRLDGEFFTEEQLEEKYENLREACDDAFCPCPYDDFDEYAEDVFEVLESPNE